MQRITKLLLCGLGVSSLLTLTASAQSNFVRPMDPNGYTNSHTFQPCGGNNFVASTVNFAPVYSGKTGAPPVTSPQATLVVSGVSAANPQTGNQTTTSFMNFPAVAGTLSGVKVYYSAVASNTSCGYLLVEGNHKNGNPFYLQIAAIGSNCYNNAANCNFSVPDDADISSLIVSFCIQDQYNNPTNPATLTIFDVWVGYGKTTCP